MRLVSALVVVAIFSIPHMASARCASKAEHASMNMRALQSELMVAALACGQRDSYNYFVRTGADNLARHGRALKAYFSRHYGDGGEYQLNKFVTQMANQASRISLNQPDSTYCREAAQLFSDVRSSSASEVAMMANQRYYTWHNIASCDGAVVAKAQ